MKRTPLADAEFLAVDFETTGTNPRRDHIVSMGWVPIVGNRIILGEAAHYIIRGVDVGQSALVHGITDTEGGIELRDAINRLHAALEGRVLLAHFAHLETSFLKAAGARLRNPVVDTFALERRHMERMGTYPRGEDLRLARVRARYGLPAYANHNALTDALACAELFLAQIHHTRAVTLRDVVS